jgi:hypothetical protein
MTPDELNKQFERLQRLATALGKDLSKFNLGPLAQDATLVGELIKKWNDELNEATSSIQDLSSAFKSVVQEISKGNVGINMTKKTFNSLSSIAQQIAYEQAGINKLSGKELENLLKKAKQAQQDAKNNNDVLKSRKEQLVLENRSNKVSLEQKVKNRAEITKINGAMIDNQSIIDKTSASYNDLLASLDARIAKENKLLNNSKKMHEGSKKLISTLTGLSTIGLFVAAFKTLVELGFKADTEITNLSKSMATSKEQAKELRNRFVEIQNSAESLFETTENLVNAQLELADAFGATQGFTERQVRDQVYLTKQIKLTAEEAAGVQQLSMANGMTAEQIAKSVIKQTASLARQTGIQLDNKKILGEVAKISGQLRLQYQNNPELIAKAVVQAQKLGITLEQSKKSSESLLNFEQSIASELEAELLTGKDLNLEEARRLALNGKSAEAAAEMLKNIGSAAEFSNMNVIQQESIANAIGMQADELANSLVQQENLNKLGSENKKQIEERVAALKAQGRIEEANQLLASVGNETQAKAALERVSAQDKFNAAVDKLKAMVASLVEGPMAGFLDKITTLLTNTKALQSAFTALKVVLGGVLGP